jgi:hypothetical protein
MASNGEGDIEPTQCIKCPCDAGIFVPGPFALWSDAPEILLKLRAKFSQVMKQASQ